MYLKEWFQWAIESSFCMALAALKKPTPPQVIRYAYTQSVSAILSKSYVAIVQEPDSLITLFISALEESEILPFSCKLEKIRSSCKKRGIVCRGYRTCTYTFAQMPVAERTNKKIYPHARMIIYYLRVLWQYTHISFIILQLLFIVAKAHIFLAGR